MLFNIQKHEHFCVESIPFCFSLTFTENSCDRVVSSAFIRIRIKKMYQINAQITFYCFNRRRQFEGQHFIPWLIVCVCICVYVFLTLCECACACAVVSIWKQMLSFRFLVVLFPVKWLLWSNPSISNTLANSVFIWFRNEGFWCVHYNLFDYLEYTQYAYECLRWTATQVAK